MTYTAITLTDPVSGISVPIMPADGVSAQVLDVAAPARAVTEDRVSAHGSYDVTQYLGAAAVSLTLLLYPGVTQTPERFWDQLAPLLDPSRRPVLIVTNDQWAGPRQLAVRFDSTAKPFSDVTNWPVQITWQAPRGTWESATPVTASIGAFTTSTTGVAIDPAPGGLTISSAPGGLVFPASSSPSPSIVTNPGTLAGQWTALLYGPCTAPALANDATGLTLEFTSDLSLAAGEYIALDSAGRTALLNGAPSGSVLSSLSFTTSDWWLMQPGVNFLRYYPGTAGPGAQALVTFSPAWMP